MNIPQSFDKLRRIRGYMNAQNPKRRVVKTEQDGATVYVVPSETTAGVSYDVFVDFNGEIICTPCKDFAKERKPCKHIFEVLDRYQPDIAPPVDQKLLREFEGKGWYTGARRLPHVPYKYEEGFAESTRKDHAYENESERVEELTIALARYLDMLHPRVGPGRPPLSPGQKMMALVLREYDNKSIRVFRSKMKLFVKQGLMRFAPARTTWVEYNTSAETTDLLIEAFNVVADVFRYMEREVIVDSTGFSPFYVSNWRDSNYGVKNYRVGTTWFKEHVAIGKISKAILAFSITPSMGPGIADAVNLLRMIQNLRDRHFTRMDTVIGDNAYLTADNFEGIKRLGARLLGPLKPRNHDSKTGLPRKIIAELVAFMKAYPDVFDEAVRSRQSVESIFNAQKTPDNHLAGIGTLAEREEYARLIALAESSTSAVEGKRLAGEAAAAGLYRSRLNEFLLRVIVQVLKRTVQMEHLFDRRISYAQGRFFSHVREYGDLPDDQGDLS